MKKRILLAVLPALLAMAPTFQASALDIPPSGTSYAYPLPAHQGTLVNLVYTMAETGSPEVLVYSESGDQVITFRDLKPIGLQTSQVDLCCLAPGVYLYFVILHYDSGNTEKLKPAKFVVIR